MTSRSAKSATADEVAAIETLMSDLERRLNRLSSLSDKARGEVSGATGDIGDFVSDALAGIMKRVRESAADVSQSAMDEAARVGNDAVKKIADQADQRPMTVLAIAAGIGFLIGFANRR